MTETDLYYMGQESSLAYFLMPEICEKYGFKYPPCPPEVDTSKRDAMPDPLKENMQ
jgi:hypothetical protein